MSCSEIKQAKNLLRKTSTKVFLNGGIYLTS